MSFPAGFNFAQPQSLSNSVASSLTSKKQTLGKQIDDFVLRSRCSSIELKKDYISIKNVLVNQGQIGVTASTLDGIVQDLWMIKWENKKPCLEYQTRLKSDLKEINSANEIHYKTNSLEVSRILQASIYLKLNQCPTITVGHFEGLDASSATMNGKWAAVAWKVNEIKESLKIFVCDLKNPIRPISFVVQNQIEFMLLDGDDSLMTLDIKGIIQLWQLHSSKDPERVLSLQAFANYSSVSTLNVERNFAQVNATTHDGQLCLIARDASHPFKIHLHTTAPSQHSGLIDDGSSYTLPKMTEAMAEALFPSIVFSQSKIRELKHIKQELNDDFNHHSERFEIEKLQLSRETRELIEQRNELITRREKIIKSFAKFQQIQLENEAHLQTLYQKEKELQESVVAAKAMTLDLERVQIPIEQELLLCRGSVSNIRKEFKDVVTFDALKNQVVILTNCSHVFNVDTIRELVKRNNLLCPLCKVGLTTREYITNLPL